MKTRQTINSQFEKLLSVRYSNGSDFWAAPDGNLVIEKTKRLLQQLGVYEIGVIYNEANERLQEINDNISKFDIILDQ